MIKKRKKQLIIIATALLAVLLLLFIFTMPPKNMSVSELFKINGQRYTARFCFRGAWHDFSDSQYADFSKCLNDDLERFLIISFGHSTGGDYITIEVTLADGTVSSHTFDMDTLSYSKHYSYIPSGEFLEFIKSLANSAGE